MTDWACKRDRNALFAMALTGLWLFPVVTFGDDGDDGDEALLQMHRSMIEAMILRHDASEFEALALDQLVLIPPGGIIENKEEVMAGVHAFSVERVLFEDEAVVRHGDTAVVVTKMTLDGEVRPVGRLGPMRTMSVLVRVDGEWRLLARTLTPCLPVAIRAGRC